MPSVPTATHTATHTVFNQVPELVDFNAFTSDRPLSEALVWSGGGWNADHVTAFGARVGSAEVAEWARLANTSLPVLHTHDRFGNRIDRVEFHPSYHRLMGLACGYGVHSQAWTQPAGTQSHAGRAALQYLQAQSEPAIGCPITMAHSAVPTLRLSDSQSVRWLAPLLSRRYDDTFAPIDQKTGAIIGMAMTEKQGGSDVRSNTTRAVRTESGGTDAYLLTGHKWFCSAPMCDAFLTLAQTDVGLSCFLVPRFCPDGSQNPFFIQRLKDKVGNRANASSEVEFRDTWGWLVGTPGRGARAIIQMVHHTRLDVALGAAGLMRQALTRAIHHCTYRSAFGKRLIQQPLMRNVLADMALEVEAATALAMRVAQSFDDTDGALARVATPVAKYWNAKRCANLVTEAMECHGGNGYVDSGPMGRLFREAPLGSIWEGSGNVQCLDVLRAMSRSPETVEAFVTEIERGQGANIHLDAAAARLKADLLKGDVGEAGARRLVGRMARTLQGAILAQHAPNAVADLFCATRLGPDGGREYGTLPPTADLDSILARAWSASR